MQLRPYQQQAVAAIWNYFHVGQKGNPVVAMPTGTGKSVVIAKFIQEVLAAYPSQRFLQLTHVKELIVQNSKKLRELWTGAPVGIYSAGLQRRDYNAPVIFGGIASVRKKAALFQGTDLVLIDECHLVSPNANTMYQAFINDLKAYNPNLKTIGFSATPYRLGLGAITDGGLFDAVCYNNTGPDSFSELIGNGWLAPLVPKKTSNEIDITGIRMRGGEFVDADVAEAITRQDITRGALQEAADVARDRKHWLVFASSIEHAQECTWYLNTMGIPAVCVHSKMSNQERDDNIAAFVSGRVRAIVNRDILTTGHDYPFVDCIVMLRLTNSPGLWVQMLGRGTRPAPSKENCLVLDFAGNTARLGPIDDPQLPRKRGSGGGVAPVKICPRCFTYNHTRAPVCVECGFEFPAAVNIDNSASTLALMSSQEEPLIEIFSVNSMLAERHKKEGSPDMLRVSYYCGAQGIRRFTKYVFLEHPGGAGALARKWWLEHSADADEDAPETVDSALEQFKHLSRPSHIRVWLNKKYPEVMAYDFTGSAFGTVHDRARLPA